MARKLKTKDNFAEILRSGDSGAVDEGRLGSLGRGQQSLSPGCAAKESDDPDVVAATMAKPGVVRKRPVGSSGPFKEYAELPSDLAGDGGTKKAARNAPNRKPQKHTKKTADEAADRNAALAFEKEQEERREHERAKEKAAQRKERERQQKAV